MLRNLMVTDDSLATFILRVVLGIVLFAHGAQKLFGWFGGYGFAGSIASFTGALGLPPLLAYLAMVAEFFGGLGLIFGLLTRVAALAIAVNMLVAIAMVHRHFGFFMNWSGEQRVEGYEYHLLVLAMAAFLVIRGAGAASIDRKLSTIRE